MKSNTLKVGLTGGIGTGKSTVAWLFSLLNIPIYIADDEAKRIMHEDKNVRQQVINIFGKGIYDEKNQLRKAELAEKVFQDKSLLQKLNNIVHPAVQKDVLSWFNKQSSPYAIEEAAILIESGAYKHMDFIIVVNAPTEVVIERVLQRDNTTRTDIINRMKNQLPMDKKLEYADFIVENDGSRLLIPQVMEIDRTLRTQS